VSDKPWNPEVERIRKAMMERFSDKLSMEEIAEFAYSVAVECTAPAPQPDFPAILERERTLVAEGVTNVKKAIKCREWLTEGRGSYEWNDDRWHGEFAAAISEILTAIQPLERIAADWTNCPQKWEDVQKAREELKGKPWNAAATPQVTPTECTHLLMNLLAVIHRDGGHYVAEYGLVKACQDAEAIVIRHHSEGTSEQASPETIDDGFGSTWSAYCPTCKQKSMYVSRPGDARCSKCESEQASPTPDKCPTCWSDDKEHRACRFRGANDISEHHIECEPCEDSWHSSAATQKGKD
jgi:hypothetical protein